jgi:hypothetical protein
MSGRVYTYRLRWWHPVTWLFVVCAIPLVFLGVNVNMLDLAEHALAQRARRAARP